MDSEIPGKNPNMDFGYTGIKIKDQMKIWSFFINTINAND